MVSVDSVHVISATNHYIHRAASVPGQADRNPWAVAGLWLRGERRSLVREPGLPPV